MPNILLIAYYFPPLGGAGVQRSLKYVKFLPPHGWHPVVLTVRETTGMLRDTTLINDIPANTKIFRTYVPLPPKFLPWRLRNWISRWLLVVDEQIGWYPFAVRSGLKIIQSENIQALYTTSAPYTSHLIGLQLKLKSGLPWIADFRDPWIGNFSINYPSSFHRNWIANLERNVIEAADAITVVSPPMRQSLLERYPHQMENKIHVIPNGYDPEDFNGIIPALKKTNKFIIVYSGSFYARGLSPDNFLSGLKLALDNGSITRDQIQVYFIGNIGKHTQKQIDHIGLSDVVTSLGYISHRDSISYLVGADILLLIIGTGPGSEVVYTGKIFEYLAARKPILALVGPGVAAQLIEQSNAGIVVSPEDPPAIAFQIIRMINLWKANNLHYHADSQVITSFERNKLAGQLSNILDNLIR